MEKNNLAFTAILAVSGILSGCCIVGIITIVKWFLS